MTDEPPLPEPIVPEPIVPEPIDPESGPPPPPPAPPPSSPTSTIPPVSSTRRLLGVSFDLLNRASSDMRRASFLIGFVILGTIGPLAIGAFAIEVAALHHSRADLEHLLEDQGGLAWEVLLIYLAAGGLVAAVVESRVLAAALLGGRFAGRPVTIRQALERSRMSFWAVVVVSILVVILVSIAQEVLLLVFEAALGPRTDVSILVTTIAAALIGAPLAYSLTGVVLGDVGPIEAIRRSVRVFKARKGAAVLVAVFETLAIFVVIVGLSAGLDLVVRLFDALGIGVDSGPAGLALMTIGIGVLVFAFGTLVYTAIALSIAPQVVMFVSLTHATPGLDHVRPGGPRDPRSRKVRWLTIPMRLGIVFGILGLVGLVATLNG